MLDVAEKTLLCILEFFASASSSTIQPQDHDRENR